MQVQTLPAAAGWAWLGTGFAIFRRNPPLLAMLVVTYWLTILLLNVLPVIGAVAASLIIPGLSVGLMQAARDLERGQKAGLQTLFSGPSWPGPRGRTSSNYPSKWMSMNPPFEASSPRLRQAGIGRGRQAGSPTGRPSRPSLRRMVGGRCRPD